LEYAGTVQRISRPFDRCSPNSLSLGKNEKEIEAEAVAYLVAKDAAINGHYVGRNYQAMLFDAASCPTRTSEVCIHQRSNLISGRDRTCRSPPGLSLSHVGAQRNKVLPEDVP